MNQKTKNSIKSLMLVLGFLMTLSALAVWKNPTEGPVSGNIDIPINVGPNTQAKSSAGLVLGFLRVIGYTEVDSDLAVGGGVKIGSSDGRGGSLSADSTTGPSNSSALLELNSTSKGFLPPRMTKAQRDAMTKITAGMMIYQTDVSPGLKIYDGTTWDALTATPERG